MYYVQWRPLFTLGLGVWAFLFVTDLLGESHWKKYSTHLSEILEGHYAQMMQMQTMSKQQEQKEKLNWSLLIWNICAFFCSLIFFTVVRSFSWILWKMFVFYKNQNLLPGFSKVPKISTKSSAVEIIEVKKMESAPETGNHKTRMIFKNRQFSEVGNQTNILLAQQYAILSKQLEDMKKDNYELSDQLNVKQQEYAQAKQELEEYKLETFVMKEKLAKTSNTLKANMKYKEFTNANQDVMARKAQNLELHLQEVSRDRDLLKSRLAGMEKDVAKMEEQLKYYQEQEICRSEEQVPERDENRTKINEATVDETLDSEITENDSVYDKFQTRMLEMQNTLMHSNYSHNGRAKFDSNSKLSLDFEESSLDNASNDFQDERFLNNRRPDPNTVKQNFMNYHAYKSNMLRPRMTLDNITERAFSATDTTGSSSDDNNSSSGPHRIISSTIEFQNLLKNLNSTSSFGTNPNNRPSGEAY